MAHVERLTVGDLAMLGPEDRGWREDIGAVAWLEGAPLLDAAGRVRVDAVRQVVDARIHLVPRFRQVLRRLPAWAGGPIWVDAPRFRAADHVGIVEVPAPADDDALLHEVERLRRSPFPADRPAWAMWLLTGLADGRVGLYIKVHHTIVDGVAGLDQMARFLDLEPDAEPGRAQPWSPRPAPSSTELLADRARRTIALLGQGAARLAHPVEVVRGLARTVDFAARTFGQTPVTATSLDRPIGAGRRLALVPAELARVRAAARHHRATVNDVLLAAVAGGYRALLTARGEPVDDVEVRASVPVSLHPKGEPVDTGNEVGELFVPLSVDQPDPSARVGLIAAASAAGKGHVVPLPASPLWTNRVVQRWIWSRFEHQHLANAYAADIPGPPVPLFLAGARVETLFPVVPIVPHVPIGVGAISYAGQLNISVVADEDGVTDLAVFVAGLRRTLDELAGRAGPTGRADRSG